MVQSREKNALLSYNYADIMSVTKYKQIKHKKVLFLKYIFLCFLVVFIITQAFSLYFHELFAQMCQIFAYTLDYY